MMQAAKNRPDGNTSSFRQFVPVMLQFGGNLEGWIRNARTKRAMRPSAVVVPHPFGEDLAQMPFSKRDQAVQAFAPDRADSPLAETIRLRRSNWRFQNLQSQAPDGLIQPVRELGIPVSDQESVAVIYRNRFPELLQRPVTGRMPSDINVQDPPRRMLKHNEYIEDLERRGYHRKEAGTSASNTAESPPGASESVSRASRRPALRAS